MLNASFLIRVALEDGDEVHGVSPCTLNIGIDGDISSPYLLIPKKIYKSVIQQYSVNMRPHCDKIGGFAIAPFGVVLTGAIALALAAVTQTARAQEQPDPEDTVYATGALPEDPAALAKRPQTRTFRAFLPERIDLSHRFPPAGHQGRQGSCVGWAVGYAARSYYNSTPGGGGRLGADRIPSPAFI
ncbi:MAG: hypothetical protein OYG32_01255, partial [Rhodospirillaceae bacterium]|nr:hypothetical protein [Rhodospirillaceae bacterium]